MKKLQIDPITSVIHIMVQNVNNWFIDKRDNVMSDKKQTKSKNIGNQVGPPVLVPMPMLRYAPNHRLMANNNNQSSRILTVRSNNTRSSTLSQTKNNSDTQKTDIEGENVIRKSRAIDALEKTNDSARKSMINQDFKTILLEGLGIDPKNIEKSTPVYCGLEYVIDVLKRAEQIN